LAQSFNGSCPTCVGLGDALVDPIWTIGVGFEQNLSTSHFLVVMDSVDGLKWG